MLVPAHVPRVTLKRLRWAPWSRHRWLAKVEVGLAIARCTTRWKSEALERAQGMIWSLERRGN